MNKICWSFYEKKMKNRFVMMREDVGWQDVGARSGEEDEEL